MGKRKTPEPAGKATTDFIIDVNWPQKVFRYSSEAHGWREGYRTSSTNFTSDGTAQTGSMNLLLAFIAWADIQAIKTIMRLFWLFQQTIPMHYANTGELNCPTAL